MVPTSVHAHVHAAIETTDTLSDPPVRAAIAPVSVATRTQKAAIPPPKPRMRHAAAARNVSHGSPLYTALAYVVVTQLEAESHTLVDSSPTRDRGYPEELKTIHAAPVPAAMSNFP